jgi:general secretion pathway protein G
MEEPQGRNAGPALRFQPPFSSVGGSCGFSLLEMMAVIDLILVLCSFSLPIYHSLVVRARETVLREDLFTLRCQIDQFTHDYARGPTSLDELVEKGYMGAVPIDP